MKANLNEVEINGTMYVPKGTEKESAVDVDGMSYLLVRTKDAGVFVGYSDEPVKAEMTLYDARRIWYWEGAASLSQLSIDGTSNPENCKFPEAVDRVSLLGVIEVLYPTEKAKKSIEGVKRWKA